MELSFYRSVLHPRQWALCVALMLVVPGLAAQPSESEAGGIDADKPFAKVWRIRGDVAASSLATGKERNLREGDVIFVGERVRAMPTAEVVLKTADAGIVAVRPGAQFVAERFSAEGKDTDNLSLRLITGSLRVISGWIGKLNRAGHRIETPTATIGIRGTDHEPYVLSAEMATPTNREGTYDKVNRGGTTLDMAGQKLDIDAGKVGFARAPGKTRQRALMTLLLPVLLDRVPDFYVPGQFDAEIDRLSASAEEDSLRELERKRSGAASPLAAEPTVPLLAPPVAPPSARTRQPQSGAVSAHGAVTAPALIPAGDCRPPRVARAWLAQLDGAIAQRKDQAVIALFAPEVTVRATVRGRDGASQTLEIGRDELVQSTLAAVQNLTNYKQRRISVEGRLADRNAGARCDRIRVVSVVIEQGNQSGKPYRFESKETYLLELRAGVWLAIEAETTQR